MTKLLPVYIACFILYTSVSGQRNLIPRDFDPKTKKGLSRFEPNVLECIQWLKNTPGDSMKEAHLSISKFILDWGKATPDVLLFPYTRVSNPIYYERDDEYGLELFVLYYGGMLEFLIENPHVTDLVKVQVAGINAMLDFCKRNSNSISHSVAADIYAQLAQNNMLESWIRQKLRKQEIKKFRKFQKKKNR